MAGSPVSQSEASLLKAARDRRRARTNWLNTFRTLFIIGAIVVMRQVAHAGSSPTNLRKIGSWIHDRVPGWLWTALKGAVKPIKGPLHRLGLSQVELVAALVLVIGLAVAYALIGATWSAWDRRDMDGFFHSRVGGFGVHQAGFIAAALIALGGCVVVSILCA